MSNLDPLGKVRGMISNAPLVTVVTIVYNGEQYLAECIESVLAQTHQNFEYVIVNNCSTDRTLEIAREYAAKDDRIRVVCNDRHVGVIENYNIGFRSLSPESKYCKTVDADDWIFPECIQKLVDIGEQYPSVGIIGSYGMLGSKPICLGLPLTGNRFAGKDACRLRLLGCDVLGAPTNLLYRARLLREVTPFFPGSDPHADQDACFRVLQSSDYGFVHQILCFQRLHEKKVSSRLAEVNSFVLDDVEFVTKYGRNCLGFEEYRVRMKNVLEDYYSFLAVAVVNLYGRKFWEYHRVRFQAIGYKLDYLWLAKAVLAKMLDIMFNPKLSIEKLKARLQHG